MSSNSDAPVPYRECVFRSAQQTETVTPGDAIKHFEYDKKSARINMRLPESLLAALKTQAQSRGIPYQRLIREAVEKTLVRDRAKFFRT